MDKMESDTRMLNLSYVFNFSLKVLSTYLRHGDPTLFGQFFLGFFARIRVGQVRVKILIQHLCGLLVEVAPLTSDKQREEIMTSLFG